MIVNPSTPIGPRDIKPTPTGKMVLDAAAGRMPAFVDTGLNVVHVDDVGLGHVLALERGEIGESYILGGTDMRLEEILAMVDEVMARPAPTASVETAADVQQKKPLIEQPISETPADAPQTIENPPAQSGVGAQVGTPESGEA